LPTHARLRRPEEFKRVFASGHRASRPPLAVVFQPNDQPSARLGLAIAKKAVPKATQRNRIKRQIRESFRQQRARLPAVDLVFYAQAGAARLTVQELRARLAELWLKVIERCAASSSVPSAATSSS
jgi:ribonuclease P protein component